MSGLLPIGYVDFSLFILRDGDQDPYVVTFAAEVDTPPFTQSNCDAVATYTGIRLASMLWEDETMIALNARVGSDGPPLIFSSSLNTVGLSSTARCPQNVAMVIRKNTGLGGRRNRGRMFWPSIGETSVDAVGNIQSTTINTFEQTLADWVEDLTVTELSETNVAQLVILHSAPPETPTPVSSLSIDPVIGTQRRRLRR